MPRMTGSQAAQFPSEIQYKGLTPITNKLDTLSSDVADLTDEQEAANEELGRIRRANELVLGQDVEESD